MKRQRKPKGAELMKKYWIKLAGCAATAVVILLIVLGMVDLHTDGILVRDGCYVIRPDEMKTYRMDVYGNSGIVGTWVNLVRDVDGASQILRFIIPEKINI